MFIGIGSKHCSLGFGKLAYCFIIIINYNLCYNKLFILKLFLICFFIGYINKINKRVIFFLICGNLELCSQKIVKFPLEFYHFIYFLTITSDAGKTLYKSFYGRFGRTVIIKYICKTVIIPYNRILFL